MNEKLTDELLDYFGEKYQVFKNKVIKYYDGTCIITFEQFIEMEMQFRASTGRSGGYIVWQGNEIEKIQLEK